MGNCTGIQRSGVEHHSHPHSIHRPEQQTVSTNQDLHTDNDTDPEDGIENGIKLTIKTSTWIRDSHELFDYESPHLMKKTFKIQHSALMTREDNDLHVVPFKDYNEQGISVPPTVHFCHFKGTYSIYDQRHKLDSRTKRPILVQPFPGTIPHPVTKELPLEEEHDMNKVWVIVRYMTVDGRTNEYRLSKLGGETIKIGRVKFRVREIQTAEDDNKTDYNSFEHEEYMHDEAPVMNEALQSQLLRNSSLRSPHLRESIFSGSGDQRLIAQHLEEEKMEHSESRNARRSMTPIIDNLTQFETTKRQSLNLHGTLDMNLDADMIQEDDCNIIETIKDNASCGVQNMFFRFSARPKQPINKPMQMFRVYALCSFGMPSNMGHEKGECALYWATRYQLYLESLPFLNGKLFWLFEVQKPATNYLILESIQLQNATSSLSAAPQGQSSAYNSQTKTLHVINFNSRQTIQIGRGHDNDLRIADISVSRTHAIIKRDPKSGNILIEDNQSKFGTLVQLRAPLVMAEHVTYYVQAGRTILKLIAQPDWSFLSSLMWGISRPSNPERVSKRQSLEENEQSPFYQGTNDPFQDLIGRFCQPLEAQKLMLDFPSPKPQDVQMVEDCDSGEVQVPDEKEFEEEHRARMQFLMNQHSSVGSQNLIEQANQFSRGPKIGGSPKSQAIPNSMIGHGSFQFERGSADPNETLVRIEKPSFGARTARLTIRQKLD